MLRTLAAAAALWAAFLMPAFGQQTLPCVPDEKAADATAAVAGEDLVWQGATASGVQMRFYLGRSSWTVFFRRADSLWCTSPSMVGTVKREDNV